MVTFFLLLGFACGKILVKSFCRDFDEQPTYRYCIANQAQLTNWIHVNIIPGAGVCLFFCGGYSLGGVLH